MIRKFEENLVVFLFGGVLYSLIEICFRGYTHWSMTITGGLCLVIMYRHFEAYPLESMLVKCLFGAMVITTLEFAVGCIVNLLLHWNVWDYSARPFNIMGQVCLLFSAMWFLLSIPAVYICRALKKKLALNISG